MGWLVRFDVKLRSGMEIYDLMPPFVQNHDRILPGTTEGRSGVEIRVIFDESWEILDQAAGEFNSTQSCYASFG
jgi:hypothetical protein